MPTTPHHSEALSSHRERDSSADEVLVLQLEHLEQFVDIRHLNEAQKRTVLAQLDDDVTRVMQGEMASDGFGIMREHWDRMADVVESSEWDKEGVFTPEHMAAQKLYTAALFDRMTVLDRHGEMTDDTLERFYQAYFNSSDSPLDFVGGYGDKMELFALSRRSESARKLSAHLVASMVYDGTFGDIGQSLQKAWRTQAGIEGKLAYLSSLDALLVAAENEMYPTDSMQASVRAAMAGVEADDGSPAFARRIAAQYLANANERMSEEWVWLEELPPDEQERLWRLHHERTQQEKQHQALLHEAFPELPPEAPLYRVARDAAATVEQGELGELRTLAGGRANLHTTEAANSLGVSAIDAELIKRAHAGGVLEVVRLEAGVDLQMLPLESQLRFFRFMAEARPERYDRLCRNLQASDEEEQRQLAEAFLATEFGDDYGDSILTIAEHATPQQSQEIFTTINNFRESSQRIAGWYESYDAEFAGATERAMNERLSDALAAMEVLARDGKLEVDTHPARNAEDYESDGRFVMALHSVEEGLEIIKNLEKSLRLVRDVLVAGDVEVRRATEENGQFAMYRFVSPAVGQALMYIRPEGAKGYDRQLEYGNRAGVEASMSFIVDPVHPHKPLDVYKDPHGVSIRFDREGRMSDESPFSEDRDPTRANGAISLDISSLIGDGRYMPAKIGRFIAAGNILRAAKTGGEAHLHHNMNHFDQAAYGSAEGFAKLAVYTAHMAEAMMATQRHGYHASRYQSIPASQ